MSDTAFKVLAGARPAKLTRGGNYVRTTEADARIKELETALGLEHGPTIGNPFQFNARIAVLESFLAKVAAAPPPSGPDMPEDAQLAALEIAKEFAASSPFAALVEAKRAELTLGTGRKPAAALATKVAPQAARPAAKTPPAPSPAAVVPASAAPKEFASIDAEIAYHNSLAVPGATVPMPAAGKLATPPDYSAMTFKQLASLPPNQARDYRLRCERAQLQTNLASMRGISHDALSMKIAALDQQIRLNGFQP